MELATDKIHHVMIRIVTSGWFISLSLHILVFELGFVLLVSSMLRTTAN